MKNIYYLIWADAILSYNKLHPNDHVWKLKLWFFISWINAINFWTLLIWLKYTEILILPKFRIDLFPGDLLDNFLVFTLEFALPFFILNYFFIFHKNRYEKIILKYKYIKGKYILIYSTLIPLLAFLSAIIYGILTM